MPVYDTLLFEVGLINSVYLTFLEPALQRWFSLLSTNFLWFALAISVSHI